MAVLPVSFQPGFKFSGLSMSHLPKAIPAQPTTKSDPFYGHETTSRLCARFITHLFAYPEYPPTGAGGWWMKL